MNVGRKRIFPDNNQHGGYHQNHPQYEVSQPLHRVLTAKADIYSEHFTHCLC